MASQQHRYEYADWDLDSQLIDYSIRDAGCFTLVSPAEGRLQVYPRNKCPGVIGTQLSINDKALAKQLSADLIHEAGFQPIEDSEE